MHQLIATQNDFNQFVTEGNTYVSSVPYALSGKWEREARNTTNRFIRSGLNTQVFGADPITLAIPDPNNHMVYFSGTPPTVTESFAFNPNSYYVAGWKIVGFYRNIGDTYPATPTFTLNYPTMTGTFDATGVATGTTIYMRAAFVNNVGITGSLSREVTDSIGA